MTIARECRLCGDVRRLHGHGRLCHRCSNRKRMRSCIQCGTQVWPRARRCRACSYAATKPHGSAASKREEIIAALERGLPKALIAQELSLTPGAVSGYCWRQGLGVREQYTGPNTLQRLDALEAIMKAAKDDWDAKVAAGLIYQPQAKRDADAEEHFV